ncbi:maleylpyruvate isomerase N-terminal domain-containing protein [Fibrella arboris]|uniref:maleylpyruvate isomerase N-terminal domain-containing protein n=1 Tax=Fibrella arboris TaxID=3242486 RepID=UPI003522C848
MKPLSVIQTAPLFPILHEKLIDLLRSLSPDDWHRPTICAGWSVKDIASHLLDTSLRTIALYRDAYASPEEKPAIESYRDLVDYLNQLNNDWVRATRRLSPAALVDWLDQAGQTADTLVMNLPPDEPAVFPVAWAGQQASPNWFHVAREYTERWHHQQQIRLAVGQTAALETEVLYHPLLDTFMRALPYAFRDTRAPLGTLLRVSVTDMVAANWFLLRKPNHWQLVTNAEAIEADTTVYIDRPYAWQLLTRHLPVAVAASYIHVEGDEALGRQVLTMRSVMM